MRSVAALLAAALASLGLAACGSGSGAEPGASREATLVLDFTPNAVHAGIYAALAQGYYADRDVDLNVHAPSASTDAPKLLESGRAQFAILDIHDLAIADAKGLGLVGVAPIVERPLAAVIAGDRSEVRTPADLAGKTIGVTGLPSDDAVLDSVLASAGLSPDDVRRQTIGFNAVADLAAGKVDAATAFWNAEGVTLRRKGIPTRVFRVDDFGAPRYPELWLTTTEQENKSDPGLVGDVVAATRDGTLYAASHQSQALDDLLAANRGLDRADQAAELRALQAARAFSPAVALQNGSAWRKTWPRWEVANGIVSTRPTFTRLFR
jgi:NitT/TauT family transport system substrate-binding protein/putative hydroxymethylpyrimidine transport system substrate-binding protein